MGSRCVTGRLLLRPDRNVHAPVGGGGRSLTDCMARLVSAPILDPRSWTPSVASVTAPASSIIYLFMPQILAVGARDEVHAMRRKKFFGTGLRFGRVRWGASVSQSVIYFTVPPRAAHPTSLRRRVFPFLKIASRVLIQTLASIAQLWIQHSLTVTPRSSARLFSLSINIERRSGPESGVDCRRSPPPGASANREPCLRTFPEARTPRSVLHGVNTHTLAPQTENTLIMLLVPGRDISAIGCPSAGGKRVDTVTSVYSTEGGLPILADP